MRIIKYQKKGQGKYLLQLEGGNEILTYEDIILKYDLLIKKEVSDLILNQIKEENIVYEIYFDALSYLKTKLRSIQETVSYLQKKGYSNLKIDCAVSLLKQQGYLDDEIYARSLCHDRMVLGNDGPLKIKKELSNLELTMDQIEEILSMYTEEVALEKIEKFILKQVRGNHSKSTSSLKQKIYQSLTQLGYGVDLIEQKLYLIEESEEKTELIYDKEYQKLKRKLERKYDGKELEYQIRLKLAQKGFSNN